MRLSESLRPRWAARLSAASTSKEEGEDTPMISVTNGKGEEEGKKKKSFLRGKKDGAREKDDDDDDGPVLTPQGFIRTIEWDMMDKSKFFPLSMATSFTVRCFLYPLTLVRTRLQVQHHSDVYHGTWDAFRKIVASEGVRGLYRGFWVSAFQVVSGVCYVTTYETIRLGLETQGVTHSAVKAFVGGGIASVVGQTIIVPFDVISQHLMIIGQMTGSAPATATATAGSPGPNGQGSNSCNSSKPKPKPSRLNPLSIQVEGRSKAQVVADITREIYRRDGLRGYYRGYTASLFTYVPSSASWWTFYHLFQDAYSTLPLVTLMPQTALQCASAMSAGCASCFITNPLDLVRTRVQVQRRSLPETARTLWRHERFGIFTKGLTARMTSSVIYSVAIIFGYESVKRWSVHEEYKDRIRW